MRPRAILCMTFAAACCAPAAAKDYGQVGTVFPIIEPDLLRVIEIHPLLRTALGLGPSNNK